MSDQKPNTSQIRQAIVSCLIGMWIIPAFL